MDRKTDEELTYDELQDRIIQQVNRIDDLQKGKTNETEKDRRKRPDEKGGLIRRTFQAIKKCFRMVLSIIHSI